MSATITPTPTTLPADFCPSTEQERLDTYAENLLITIGNYYGQFVISDTTPDPADNDKAWLKLDGSGDPIGWFLYVSGAWTQIDAPNVWTDAGAGVADAYTATFANYPSSTGPRTNDTFIISIPAANTGACTLNVNGLGAEAIKSAGSDPWSGALEADKWYVFVYDGTNFEVTAIKQVTAASISPGTDKQFLRTNSTPAGQWESAYYGTGQAIPAAAGSVTFTHGLGSTPLFFHVRLKCTTSDLNYSVGDEVDVQGLMKSNSNHEQAAFACMANASSIVVIRNVDAPSIQMINKTTGSDSAAITEASWQVIAYAIR